MVRRFHCWAAWVSRRVEAANVLGLWLWSRLARALSFIRAPKAAAVFLLSRTGKENPVLCADHLKERSWPLLDHEKNHILA